MHVQDNPRGRCHRRRSARQNEGLLSRVNTVLLYFPRRSSGQDVIRIEARLLSNANSLDVAPSCPPLKLRLSRQADGGRQIAPLASSGELIAGL